MKSFWEISVLLLSLIGFQLRDDATFLSMTLLELKFFDVYFPVTSLGAGWTISSIVIIVCIPIY